MMTTNSIELLNAGLVLEGGGMRGLYTAGVLDYFLDNDLHFGYVVGVSAGACHASSYVSRQRGRSRITNTAFLDNWRYMSLRSLLTTGSYFGMDFLFDTIPNQLVPFDYDTFLNSSLRFEIGTTDCRTGESRYFDKSEVDAQNTVLRASCSLPLMSRVVAFQGHALLDGGISDPIPVRRAMEQNKKLVIILTQNQDYRKKAISGLEKTLIALAYRRYPALVETLKNRHNQYNQTLELIEELERLGTAIVVRPSSPLEVDRYQKDPAKLHALYEQGYRDAKALANGFKALRA